MACLAVPILNGKSFHRKCSGRDPRRQVVGKKKISFQQVKFRGQKGAVADCSWVFDDTVHVVVVPDSGGRDVGTNFTAATTNPLVRFPRIAALVEPQPAVLAGAVPRCAMHRSHSKEAVFDQE